jgi:hypothetical protein
MTTPKKTRKVVRGNRPATGRSTASPTKKPGRSATKKGAERPARPSTKQADLIALLERSEGATIAQMMAKTNWQPHSVRAALSGFRKRGITIFRDRNAAGVTVYRIAEAKT